MVQDVFFLSLIEQRRALGGERATSRLQVTETSNREPSLDATHDVGMVTLR